MKITNTLTGKKEMFKPLKGKKVKMFVCGPTVYDYSHIGHAKTYVAFDVIARYLRYKGYDLFYLMNITDVDDKIIERAKQSNRTPSDVAREFEDKFYEDMDVLYVRETINQFARASENMNDIVDQIARLIKNGYAYVTETGIYFDISKFKKYGKLSHQDTKSLSEHRIEPDSTKRNPQDFALWKKHNEGEPFWELRIEFNVKGKPKSYLTDTLGIKISDEMFSVIPGKLTEIEVIMNGRPGWHIEDTAITEKFLGEQYDLHGGAIDLIFPHHECEIAQMESLSKKPLVKYWTHGGFLTVNGVKMSKSLGNFTTIRDMLRKVTPEQLRLYLVKTNYRNPVDFNDAGIQEAKESHRRLQQTYERVIESQENSKGKNNNKIKVIVEKAYKSFEKSMDDDFSSSEALAAVFNFIREINKIIDSKQYSKRDMELVQKFFDDIDSVFRVLSPISKNDMIPAEIIELVQKREDFRKKKQFKESDSIRDQLKVLGYEIIDTPQGSKAKKI